jgi:ribosome assembly protein 4
MKRQRLVAAEELFAARKKVPAPSISAALPSADAVVSVPTAPAAPPSTEGRTVLVQLQAEGSTAAASPTLDIPADTTPRQLEALVNKLLNASEAQPYTFYINGEEVLKDVASSLGEQALNAEATLMIRYQPLAVFRVMPVTRCTDTLEGHADSVLHVSFAPDGRRLASGGGDAIVRFWDAASASIRHVCVGHKHHVLATAWSPDGRLFASGDKAGALRLWDPDTGKEAVSIRAGHAAWITAIAWEPLHRSTAADARCELVATASKDKTVKVWNARTGLLQFELGGHSDSVEALRWGGEGLIFTGSRDRKVLVWAVADDKLSAKLIRSLDSHGHRINALALNTDYMCRTGPYDHKGARFVSDVEGK